MNQKYLLSGIILALCFCSTLGITLRLKSQEHTLQHVRTITIATNPGVLPLNFLVFLGNKIGMFQKHNLEIITKDMNSDLGVHALMSESVDYIPFTRAATVASLQDAPITTVIPLTNQSIFYLVAKPNLEAKDIKTIGITGKYDLLHYYALLAIERNKMTDVQLVESGGNSMALRALLSQGKVDAIIVGLPAPFEFEAQGFSILDRFADYHLLIGLSALNTQNSQDTRELKNALAHTRDYIFNHPEETKQYLTEFFNLADNPERAHKVAGLYAALQFIFADPFGTPTTEGTANVIQSAKVPKFETLEKIQKQRVTPEDRAKVTNFTF